MVSEGALSWAYLIDAPLPEVASVLDALGYVLAKRNAAASSAAAPTRRR